MVFVTYFGRILFKLSCATDGRHSCLRIGGEPDSSRLCNVLGLARHCERMCTQDPYKYMVGGGCGGCSARCEELPRHAYAIIPASFYGGKVLQPIQTAIVPNWTHWISLRYNVLVCLADIIYYEKLINLICSNHLMCML